MRRLVALWDRMVRFVMEGTGSFLSCTAPFFFFHSAPSAVFDEMIPPGRIPGFDLLGR